MTPNLEGRGEGQPSRKSQDFKPMGDHSLGGSDRPERLRCICNLCQCGSHRCSNFGLGDEPNRCLEGANMDQLSECRCGREDAERYLTRLNSSASVRSSAAEELSARRPSTRTSGRLPRKPSANSPLAVGDTAEPNDQELLHVLVSRPTLASKPRDNIVFEGDMDLRTTFETSYEALAKMRLDSWRKYQQAEQRTASKSPAELEKPSRLNETTDVSSNSKKIDYYNKLATDEGSKSTVIDNNNNKYDNALANSAGSMRLKTERVPKGSAIQSATPIGFTRSERTLEHQTPVEIHTLPHSTRSVAAQVVDNELPAVASGPSTNDDRAKIDLSSLPAAGTPSNRATPVKDNWTSDYIDPDLAPIIVYDSNMNRLEKVGLRRRSKYRPSTSLRSGARGLFGDLSIEEPMKRANEPSSSTRQHVDEAPVDNHLRNAAGASPTNRFPEREMDSYNQNLDRKTRRALDARNLGDSHQPQYLTLGQQNIPIDSKRKVKDNINMTDHIEEQGIVAARRKLRNASTSIDIGSVNRYYQDLRSQEGEASNSQIDYSKHCAMTSNENDNIYQQEDVDPNRRLIDEEEAEAVAEIQRITASPNDNRIDTAPKVSVAKPQATLGADSKREKLQRTCQQQNFHISENAQPEAREKFRGSTVTDALRNSALSPPSRSYKDLFRESPDFIMTTGGFVRKESSIGASTDTSANNKLAAMPPFVEEVAQKYLGGGDDGKTPCDQCRVHNLDRDFQFVGSESGHKYFIHKPMSPQVS